MELKKYSISQASDIIGYQSHVLRFYEKEFNLKIPRNKANHRYYTVKEIEVFQYIKSLQEKGLTNGQIKEILNAPEEKRGQSLKEETALTLSNELYLTKKEEELFSLFQSINKNVNQGLEKVLDEIATLKKHLNEKDQDVLICENAKLKMKIKQKTYEIAELKEQINREKNKKTFLGRLFR